MADLKYIFEKGSGRGVYNDYQYLKLDTELVIIKFQSRTQKEKTAL